MVDQQVLRELRLFTENDVDIYRHFTTPIVKNLRTKQAQGKYNHDVAVKAFMYLAEAGARKYAREHGGGEHEWHIIFPVDVRRQAAMGWRDEFEVNSRDGQYDNETYLPKKYLNQIRGFQVGERVSAHPATDAFMRGDRYGLVTKIGPKFVSVRMDKSNKIRKFSPQNLESVASIDSRRL